MADLVEPRATAPRVASWNHPLVEPNLEDARIRHTLAPLGRMPGLGRLEEAYRQRFRLKRWQYMTAVSDELFLAFIVGTAGFASNGFVYAAELPHGTIHKRLAINPLTVGTRLAPSSAGGAHRFETRGLAVAIDNLDGGRRFGARIEARTEGGERLTAELAFASAPRDEHLAVCHPLPGGRWNYTHKFAAFTVAGEVTIGERRFALRPERAFGTMDFTKQYAMRHAVWRWIAFCGTSTRGATVGLNLVDPTPIAPVSENALWVDGAREAVTGVRLDAEAGGPWRIAADTVELEVRPIARFEQRLDVPLLRHRLRHMIGAFSGRVRTRDGQVHELADVVGVAEDYDTWW